MSDITDEWINGDIDAQVSDKTIILLNDFSYFGILFNFVSWSSNLL